MTEEELKEIFNSLLLLPVETEWLEFKSARSKFNSDDIGKYFSALSNEANLKKHENGWLVFGVDNSKTIVGSIFRNDHSSLHSLKHEIAQHTNNNISFTEIHELHLPEGRVVLFQIPPAHPGIPTSWKGHFYGRDGESLVPLNPIEYEQIRNQIRILDYSAQICSDASLDDLSDIAISKFRSLWFEKSGNHNVLSCSLGQLLSDAELLIDGKLTYASLILLGKKESLLKYQPNAEIIFEHRSSDAEIRYQARENFRVGFFSILYKLWDLINARNGLDHLQKKFFIKDIPYFDKEVIREAILNAVCHRDYQFPSSVFIRQFPKTIIIENPGGFPNGVTPENILYTTNPRNRRIAEIFEKCGLVERSGQGADQMFKKLIEESKPLPDYSPSDAFKVVVKISGEIQDEYFIQYISRIYNEKNLVLSIEELLTLDEIRRNSLQLTKRQAAIEKLLIRKIIFRRAVKGKINYYLSRNLYTSQKTAKLSSKRAELENQKQTIINFLNENKKATLSELIDLFPRFDRNKVYNLLRPLKKEGLIEFVGDKKTGFWKLVK